jgi:hypothetical protein
MKRLTSDAESAYDSHSGLNSFDAQLDEKYRESDIRQCHWHQTDCRENSILTDYL